MTCEVISSHPIYNFTWIRGNKLPSPNHRIKILSLDQSLLVTNRNDPLDTFACVVTDSVGSSKPCRLHVPGELKQSLLLFCLKSD